MPDNAQTTETTSGHGTDPTTPPEAPGSRASRVRGILLATLVVIAIAVGGTLFVRARLDPGDPVSGVSEVAVRDDEFGPASVQVPAGTTITWRWEGKNDHNVVGDDFESPVQSEGVFTRTFSEPGSYDYECTLHFFMRGRVVVTDA